MKTLLLLAGLAGCAVGVRLDSIDLDEAVQAPTSPKTRASPATPHAAFSALVCNGRTPVMKTASMTFALYDNVTSSVMALMTRLGTSCTETSCPQGAFAGCVVRLAGHDFMDFQDGNGGSDGCINLEEADNRGLAPCLYEGLHGVSLQSVYANFCDKVSLADFIVIAAEAVMTQTREFHMAVTPFARPVRFRSVFKFGRTTATDCKFSRGRLPSAHGGCNPVQRTFVTNLGLNWAEAAALMGAHTLGRAHLENLGFDGWWSHPSGSRLFNSDYFGNMVTKGWWMTRTEKGQTQWDRVDKGARAPGAGRQMMLSTDLCLAWGESDAATVFCCPWQPYDRFKTAIKSGGGDFCGNPGSTAAKLSTEQLKKDCCGPFADFNSCDGDRARPKDPPLLKGKATDNVTTYATDGGAWLDAFHVAWTKATERGASGLKRLTQ